ncbi:hypothetical protein CYMTET_12702 [Cymbomonas tetramitiformis]|uniref:Protein kinase domain-containing protein n=2 Tax=Cymbomonas tetramitiformis TaxID=36881 RepID=A0AAE0GL55_9CHLO|nr:hypothetical protein CYMTET_12702 [Cymbomonas tetramitiformis]
MVPLDENEPVSVDADFLIAVTEIIFWASVGDLEKLKTFCKNKAFNFKQAYDYDRRSPLHLACVNGCRNVCEWLITEAKVDVNFVDRFGNTPLMGAVLGKHDACIRLLKEKGGKVLEEGFLVSLEDSCVLNTHRTSELPKMDAQYIELIYLASEGILPGLRQSRELLSSGIVKDYDDRTPLHLAAANGKLEAVDYLLSIEVAVNAVDRFGLTPLEGAMRSNLPVRDKVVAALERHDGKVYQHGQLVPSNEADIKAPVVKQTKNFDHWEVQPRGIQFGEKLGEGAFAIVHACMYEATLVAAKILKVDILGLPTQMQQFKQEIEMMTKLHHPHVVQFFGACTTASKPFLLLEHMETSLETVLRGQECLGVRTAVRYFADTARGLAYLHSRRPHPIVHRDLKPGNIMISASGQLKLCDFGLSRTLKNSMEASMSKHAPSARAGSMSRVRSVSQLDNMVTDMTAETGSYRYMAPEVFKHEKYGVKADCYALALIAFQMFEWRAPFDYHPEAVKAAYSAAVDKQRPRFAPTSSTPKEIIALVEELWDRMHPPLLSRLRFYAF